MRQFCVRFYELGGTRTYTEAELEQARRDWDTWLRNRHVAVRIPEEARHADHAEPSERQHR